MCPMRPDKASKHDPAKANGKAAATPSSPNERTSGTEGSQQTNSESVSRKTASGGDANETNDFQTAASSLLALGFSAQPSRPQQEAGPKSPMLSLLSDVAINEPMESQASKTGADDGHQDQNITPGTRDVLCGRGRGYFNHPGNRRMLEIVNQNKGRYKAAGKTMKTIIVRDVTDIIQAHGTRFLKLSNSHWHEVSALEAHKKVCHCLREEKNNADGGFDAETRKLKQVEMVDHLKQVKEELLMGTDSAGDGVPPPGGKPNKSRRKSSKKKAKASSASVSSSSSASDLSSAASSARGKGTGAPVSNYISQEREGGKDHYPREIFKKTDGGSAATAPQDRVSAGAVPHQDKGRNVLDTGAVPNKNKINTDETGPMPDTAGPGEVQSRHSPSMRPHDTGRPETAAESHSTALEAMGMRGIQGSQYGIVVGEPSPLDVLFGMDPAFATTGGNMRLRQMVRAAVGYSVTSIEDKLLMARGIVGQLKLAGARFLTRQSAGPRGFWFIVADVEAEALIFRYLCEEENTTKAAMLRVGGFGAPPGLLAGGTPHAPFAGPSAAFSSSLAARSAMLRAENEALDMQKGVEAGELTSIYAAASVNIDPKDIAKKRKLEGFANESSLANGPNKLLRPYQTEAYSPAPAIAMARNLAGGDQQESRPLAMGPGSHDVVCGRGRGNFRHPGNRRLLRIFQEYKHRYRAATKTQKTNIAKEIVTGIQSRGGRFLKRTDDGVWITVCDKEAFRKVCHGIRDIPKDQDDIDVQKKAAEDDSVSSGSTSPTSRTMSPAPGDPQTKKEATGAGGAAASFKGFKASTNRPKDDPSRPETSKSIEPEPADIVCGRGRGNFSHPGNRRMLNIIHRNRERYRNAPTKAEKAEISREVMAAILSNGGRFLKRKGPDSDVWEEVEFKDALKKVCHGIRDSLCNGVKAKTKKGDKNQPTSLTEPENSNGEKEKSSSDSTSSDPGAMKLFELAELAQKRATSEEQNKATDTSSPQNPAMDTFYMRSLQAERAAAFGIPMHAFIAAQKAAAATGMTVEEVIMAERRKGRQCSIS